MTHLSRTTHGIAYDTTHDEIVAPNPLAAAIVVFRGGATGEEAPIRTIQGPRSGLSRPETVAVDETNNELFVGDPGDRRVLVYRREADGDVERPSPWNTGTEGFIGVWDDEKDDGDAPPRSVVKGRSTGIVHPAGVTFNARDGEVIAPDAIWNGLFTFLKPELFAPAAAGAR